MIFKILKTIRETKIYKKLKGVDINSLGVQTIVAWAAIIIGIIIALFCI